MQISKIHADHLRSENFTDADIAWMAGTIGVRSISQHEAKEMGFAVESGGGLLFPFAADFSQLRTDNPPIRGGKPCKYLTQSKRTSKAWMPEGVKVLTEGAKDAYAGTLRGCIPTGALAGVSHYRKALSKACGYTILFDADGWQNPHVFASLVKAAQWCNGKIQLVPEIDGQPKAGLCEYFKAGYTANDYTNLIAAAMSPKEFLLELPKHWKSLPADRAGRALRTIFSLAGGLLDPASLDLLAKICKNSLKPHGVSGATIDRELKITQSRLAKRKREAKLQDWARSREQHPELDLTDVPDGAESKLLKSMRSVKTAVGKDLRLNELTKNLEFKGSLLDPNTFKLFVAKVTDVDVCESDCVQILGAIGKKQAYHPVKDWLEKLHDVYGETTIGYLDAPASRYLKTENPLYDTYLKNQLIAAVARIYEQGCKSDHSVVLQGVQNLLKSTFWNTLAGDEWFDDNLGSDVENKDELLKLHRTWFEEWGEIDRITSKKELGVVKSFLSRKVDTFRAPYERTAVEHPRRGVIVGTVNPSEFLRDEEDRRLWVIPVTQKIDIKTLQRDRDAIWAAAVALYKSGAQWWLTLDEEIQQRESNKQFAVRDVWEEPVESWLSSPANTIRKISDEGETIEYVRTQKILIQCLGMTEIQHHTNLNKKRVQDILRRLGWQPNEPMKLPGFKTAQRAWSKSPSAPTSTSRPQPSAPFPIPQPSAPTLIPPTDLGDWDSEFDSDSDDEWLSGSINSRLPSVTAQQLSP